MQNLCKPQRRFSNQPFSITTRTHQRYYFTPLKMTWEKAYRDTSPAVAPAMTTCVLEPYIQATHCNTHAMSVRGAGPVDGKEKR
jgi:hypothetical protein